jgi:uncharacterized protein
MIKWLLVIGVVAAIYVFFIKKTPSVQNNKAKKTDDSADNSPSNDLVECATCGVYCELNEAIVSGSKYYCSDECLEKA